MDRGSLKKVATIVFDEGEPYKKYEMNIFKGTKITIKTSKIIFKGTIETLIRRLK